MSEHAPHGHARQLYSTIEQPRDVIVQCAIRLFSERGYTATTVTDIAKAAGMHQSSIYYWFNGKEELLQAALGLNREALDFSLAITSDPVVVSVTLYRVLHYDTLRLCLSPLDFNEIEWLAETQPDVFSEFWLDYSKLHKQVRSLITDGIASGEFIDCDVELTASTALCLNEGVQKRYRSQEHHIAESTNPFVFTKKTAQQYAGMSATTTLRALMTEPETLPDLLKTIEDPQREY